MLPQLVLDSAASSTTCRICGAFNTTRRCPACAEVDAVIAAHAPGELLLVVDGSFSQGRGLRAAGAGLVLARAEDEAVVAVCVAAFDARSSLEAETQAIVRGLRWAAVDTAWSDSTMAIAAVGGRARFCPAELRDPLHNLAHRLANIGRLRDWDRLERVWIPGERW